MLTEMRAAVPAAASIDTLVNTHANGDHCYGNQLVGGAAHRRLGGDVDGDARAAAGGDDAAGSAAPSMGRWAILPAGVRRFEFEGVELALPEEPSAANSTQGRRTRRCACSRSAPRTRAATRSCWCRRRVLFTGDICLQRRPPIAWAGPISNWAAACDRILAMDVDVIVPGMGRSRTSTPCAT